MMHMYMHIRYHCVITRLYPMCGSEVIAQTGTGQKENT
jgi:hypothetical protein